MDEAYVPDVASLDLRSPDGGNLIVYSDERKHVHNDTAWGIGNEYFTSVTLVSGNSSWGEFMSREDTLKLAAWLQTMLRDDEEGMGTTGEPSPESWWIFLLFFVFGLAVIGAVTVLI